MVQHGAKAFKEQQFKRELRLRQIAGATRASQGHEVGSSLQERRAARAARLSQAAEPSAGAKELLKAAAAPPPAAAPQLLFDPESTLNLTVLVAREMAMERLEREMAQRPEGGVKDAKGALAAFADRAIRCRSRGGCSTPRDGRAAFRRRRLQSRRAR